jgi:hypothetical protein
MPVNNALTPEGSNALGAAFGYYPQLRRNRQFNDPVASSEMPLQFLRGRFAITAGTPSDILNTFRSPMPMEMYGQTDYAPQQQVPYGSQELMQTLPLPPTSPAGQLAGNVGSFVPMTPAEALQAARVARQVALAGGKVAKKGARLVGEEFNATMLGERPNTLLGAVTPQPMFAVPPSIAREGNPIQSAVVLVGDKIFTGRTHGDALNRAVYEGTVRKEGGKYIYPKGAEVNSDLFMTNSGQIIDRLQASKMFDVGASETAIEKGLMQSKPSGSMTVEQYTEQAKAIKKQKEQPAFQYPQQEALRLAQERASLPVKQGGLGLPKDNTPQMRAQAMGFEGGWAHGSPNPNITTLKPSITGAQGEGVYATNYLPEANTYAMQNEGATNYPLFINKQNALNVGQNNPYDILGFDLQGQLAEKGKNAIISTQQETPEWLIKNGVPFMPSREHYVSMPENFRSRFAAFDPFRKDVATATAMGVLAPDLLAAQQDPYSQNEMRKFMRQGR